MPSQGELDSISDIQLTTSPSENEVQEENQRKLKI